MFDDKPRDIMEAAQWRALRPPDHYAGIQFTSQSVSSTKATTTTAPKIMSCPRTNFGRSAALILIITPPEHIEMYMRSSSQTALWRVGGPAFFSGAAGGSPVPMPPLPPERDQARAEGRVPREHAGAV